MLEDAAPDLIEPLRVWRAWAVRETDEGWRLSSIHYRELWPVGGPVEAWCYRSSKLSAAQGITHDRHLAPAVGCQCGVYGATELERAREYLVPEHTGWESISVDARYVHRVVGLAKLWGRTVECAQGYRASYAYPARLWIPTRMPDGRPLDVEALALDLLAYGVPVELVDAGARGAIVDHLREGAAQP
jgi:hypothetical protein